MNSTDEQIKMLLNANADKAFELIYRTYYDSLCRYALRFLDDAIEAEDIVQNTLITLWKRLSDLKNVSSLRSYLFRSVQNACINSLRDNKLKKQSISEIDIELLEIANDTTELYSEKMEAVKKAIDSLPAQSKKILELNRFDGFSYKEIAEQLNISHRTVDTHLTAAMRQLREKLNPILVCILILICIK